MSETFEELRAQFVVLPIHYEYYSNIHVMNMLTLPIVAVKIV